MSSVEENFPRGGTQKKGKEEKTVRQPTVDDNLFKTQHEEVTRKRKKKHEDQKEPKKLKSEKKAVSKTSIKDFELLSAESLTEGTLLLGCVKKSNQFDLVISLPNGLTGFVKITCLCDAYSELLNKQVATDEPMEELNSLSDLFPPGMLVRCAVVGTEKNAMGHQKIHLTVNPKDVNKGLNPTVLKEGMLLSGCVSSIEDHGYLIDIGIPGTKAFLPRQKAQGSLQSLIKGTELMIGQYLNCLIEEVKNGGRIIRISINQSEVASAIATEKQNWSLANLLPGLVVKAQVQEVTTSGISLSFLSSFTGIVDFMHTNSLKTGHLSPNQMVKACILSNNPASKAIRLSLRPVFLQPGIQLGQLSNDRIGVVVTDSKVEIFLKNIGAVFTLDDGSHAFSHIKYLPKTSKSFKTEVFKRGSKHTCRIIDYSLIDDMIVVSLKEHIVNAPFLRYHDIHPGQVLEGKVLTLKPLGMQVKFTESIRGFVPNLHLADVKLKQPEKKYSTGTTVKCRVLVCNPETRKLILTLKRTLVNSKLPVLDSFEDAKPGLITHGFVACVKDFGCIVKFYNDVRGLVPTNELGLLPLTAPQEAFYEGQVVKVTVLTCEPEQERLLLSFRLEEDAVAKNAGRTEISKDREMAYKTGQIVDVKILNKKEDGLEVAILPNNVSAYLPMAQLSDHVSNSRLWWHWLKEGDVLQKVICLHSKGGHILLSRKPALISFMEDEHVVKSFADIQPGILLTGFVRNIMSYGVFVEFPYGLTGLAPKSAMSDKFVTDTKDHFVVGQTVLAKVTSVDEEKQRILLSLKMSECSVEGSVPESFGLLEQYFNELQEIMSFMSNRDDSSVAKKLSKFKVGQRLELVVTEVKADGSAVFSGPCVSDLIVIAIHSQLGGKSILEGQKAKAVVLCVDLLKSKIYVSLREELLSLKAKKLILNSQYEAIVHHVATEHAVVSLLGTDQLTAIPVASHLNDTFRFDSEKLKTGQSVKVVLKSTQIGDHGMVLAMQSSGKKCVIRSRHESETLEDTSLATKQLPSSGDIVRGIVKSVKPTHVLVAFNDRLTGSLHASQILDDVTIGTFPTSLLKVGQKITARVIGGRGIKSHKYLPITHTHFTRTFLELSIRPSELKRESKATLNAEKDHPEEPLKPGQTVTCYVKNYNVLKKRLEVEISPTIRGRILQLLLSSNPKDIKHARKCFKKGQALIATVIDCDISGTKLALSLTGTRSLEKGTIVLGTVKRVIPHVGLHIILPFGRIGRVSLFHLNDSYTEQPLEDFGVGKIVRCYILSIEDNAVKVSLRPSRINPKGHQKVEDPEIASLDNIQNDQLIRGYVKSITASGISLGLSDSVVGQISLQYVTPFFVPDHLLCMKYIHTDQLLTAKVLSINRRENLVELSLLPEDTGKPSIIPCDEKPCSETDTPSQKSRNQRRKRSESEQEVTPAKKRAYCTEEGDSGVEVYYREEEEKEKKHKKKSKQGKEVPRLKISTSFMWEEGLNVLDGTTLIPKEQSSDSEEENDAESMAKKQTKKKQELEKQKAEKELSKLEAALMDPKRQPQTADDFDRLVLGSPDSSILWLQFMAFHLQATEIEKARAVAERALKTISFREEQEKLNVWVALLNLENMYGTEEGLMKVFERAVQYNEPLKVFQQLADIYSASEKYKEAEDLYSTMLKRFRQEKSVWVKYTTFLLKRGLVEAAHRLMPRALKCLPDKEHVDVISKLAQLEFQFGDAEHGKAMFENMLSTYPKRTDVWSVYIDVMIKHGSQKEVRDIFERVIHLNLTAKKMKFFFKRYLEYEKKYGTVETIQAVKAAALEYVESKNNLAES
ncbi:PREDICTED: protein RRP5 homolog isoform X1 [Thamnophis sirtalis]|uniref:Protein RRP5 homolog n=1 Tax=Thamnophis sirtalis TaxID=35019 RepID=A0A6I9YJH1_9SAUR|nr:PREDICTED: protein RRP5 homolog isoform X1 [Thamnophis sirtalis]